MPKHFAGRSLKKYSERRCSPTKAGGYSALGRMRSNGEVRSPEQATAKRPERWPEGIRAYGGVIIAAMHHMGAEVAQPRKASDDNASAGEFCQWQRGAAGPKR